MVVYKEEQLHVGIYMFKVTIETLEQAVKYVQMCFQWRRSDVFIVSFEHISHLVLVFVLLPSSG